jgi:hypothetical protein
MRDDGNPNGVGSWLGFVEGRQALRPTRRDWMVPARRLSDSHAVVAHKSLIRMQRP